MSAKYRTYRASLDLSMVVLHGRLAECSIVGAIAGSHDDM